MRETQTGQIQAGEWPENIKEKNEVRVLYVSEILRKHFQTAHETYLWAEFFISCALSKAAGFEVVVSVKEVFWKEGKKEWAVEKENGSSFFSSPPHIFSLSYLYPPTHVQFSSLEI